MRDILFKAKCIQTGDWIEGDIIYTQESIVGVGETTPPSFNREAIGCGVEDQGCVDRYDGAEYGYQLAVDEIFQAVVACDDNTLGQFSGKYDINNNRIFEGDKVAYYTTYHKHESAVDMFGVEPHMEFDCGSDMHRKYEGVIRFFPSVGFVISSCKVYECFSEGEYPIEVPEKDWEFIKNISYKSISCSEERLKIIGNIHD